MAVGKKTGGRQKGTPNKVSGTVRENVVTVFDQIGGLESMAKWAVENQTEFYRLYSKLLPMQQEITGEDGGPVKHAHSVVVEFVGKNKSAVS